MNVFITNFRRIIRTEEPYIGRTQNRCFLRFSLSSSSQNNTEKQITSQKSSSSVDCRHFNFDLVGKKIPSASLFYRLIRYKRFNGNQGIARIASIASVVFHHEKLFLSDRDDSSDRDNYLETSLNGARSPEATNIWLRASEESYPVARPGTHTYCISSR